jgi:Tfp pilus assembly PilM family ATPase
MFRKGLDRLSRLGLVSTPKPHVAIDLGFSGMKLLQLSGGENPRIEAAHVVSVPEALREDASKRLEFQLAALPKALKDGGFTAKYAACTLPAGQTLCKHTQASGDGALMQSIVSANLASQLSCPSDALRVRCLVVPGARPAGSSGGDAGTSEVIAIATGAGLIERLMGALKSARLEPVGIHAECQALLRAFDHLHRRAEDASLATMYLDLGAGTTKVCIGHGAELVFHKNIAMGGRFLDRAVASIAKMTMPEANRARFNLASVTRQPAAGAVGGIGSVAAGPGGAMALTGIPAIDAAMAAEAARSKTTPGEPVAGVMSDEDRRAGQPVPGLSSVAEDDVQIDLSEPLSATTDEVASCMRYYEALFPGRRVQRVIFVGGEARHTPLCHHMARTLRLSASVADPFARFGRDSGLKVARSAQGEGEGGMVVDLNQPQPGWAVAVGVALSPPER